MQDGDVNCEGNERQDYFIKVVYCTATTQLLYALQCRAVSLVILSEHIVIFLYFCIGAIIPNLERFSDLLYKGFTNILVCSLINLCSSLFHLSQISLTINYQHGTALTRITLTRGGRQKGSSPLAKYSKGSVATNLLVEMESV